MTREELLEEINALRPSVVIPEDASVGFLIGFLEQLKKINDQDEGVSDKFVDDGEGLVWDDDEALDDGGTLHGR